LSSAQNYIVPTSGKPIRGLIQDHIISSVLITLKDTWFTKDEYLEMIYNSIFHIANDERLEILPPTILKPTQLWSGKQLFSNILKIVSNGKIGLNIDGKSKIQDKLWGKETSDLPNESMIIIRDNELLSGIIDSSQIGSSEGGIVHYVYEIYGYEMADVFLTCLCRLFTHFLQYHGFTCGLNDLLLKQIAEDHRNKVLKTKNDVALKGIHSINQKGQLNFLELPKMIRTLFSKNFMKHIMII
jgi:DNA-directed RNA polymerase I subunit RPA1